MEGIVNKELLIRFFVLSLFAATSAAAQITVTPTMMPTPPGTLITVNNGPGEHYDPHVSGDLVSYGNTDSVAVNITIRYFNLAAMTDNGVPNSGTFDFRADVSGQTIVFTRTSCCTSAIFSFDTSAPNSPPVEIAPQAGAIREEPQISTTTIAWKENFLDASADIVAYDRASRSITRLANDSALNQNPAISADGSAITWEKCASVAAPCDIWSAVRTGTTWVAHQLTNSAGGCSHPDTNGQVVVYACDRGSGDHLFWQAVTGGVEFALAGSLQERSPSIAGQLVAFAGLPSGAASHNEYVLDLTTFNLYQMPSVPGVQQLNDDISITPGGKVNVVWQVVQTNASVFAFTFNLPSAALTNLGNLIAGFGLPAGTANSLLAKVNAAQASLAAGNTTDACNDLGALINEASAQSGKKLTVAEAAAIIAAATAIRTALGCP
jgi:hypothetical protein